MTLRAFILGLIVYVGCGELLLYAIVTFPAIGYIVGGLLAMWLSYAIWGYQKWASNGEDETI